MKAFAPGIYPRSQALVQATRDFERGRTTEHAVDEQFERDLQQFVEAQEQAGLDLLADGLLRWHDIFRPLADRAEGLDARPLTRFLDTNTFYRAVLVEGEPHLEDPLPAPNLPSGRWVATLPSPLAFSFASDRAASADALARDVLAPQIEAYGAAGCALVVLSEPFLAREGGLEELRSALSGLPDSVPLALHLVFADAGAVIEDLADLPVDAIGVDFYSTSVDAIPTGFPKTILAGVVDVRSSAVEGVAEVARFAAALADREPAGLSLVPNGDLQFVPEPIARRKLGVLGDARAPLQEVA